MIKVNSFIRTFRFKMLALMLICTVLPSSAVGLFSYTYSKNVLIERGKEQLMNGGLAAADLANELGKQVKEGILTKEDAFLKMKDLFLGPLKDDGKRDISKVFFNYGDGAIAIVAYDLEKGTFMNVLSGNESSEYVEMPFQSFKEDMFGETDLQKRLAKKFMEYHGVTKNDIRYGKNLVIPTRKFLASDDLLDNFWVDGNVRPGEKFSWDDPNLVNKLERVTVYIAPIKSMSNDKLFFGNRTVAVYTQAYDYEFYEPIHKLATVISLLVSVTTAIVLICAYIFLRRNATVLTLVGRSVNKLGQG